MIHNSQQFFLAEMNFKSSIWHRRLIWLAEYCIPHHQKWMVWFNDMTGLLTRYPAPTFSFPCAYHHVHIRREKSCSKSLRFYFCLRWQKLLNSCMLIEVLHLLIETRQGKTCFSTLFMLANWVTRKILFFPLLLLVIFITGFWHIIYTSFSRKCK